MGFLAAFGVVILLGIGIYSFGYAAKQTSLLFVVLLECIFGLVIIFPLLFSEDGFTLSKIFTIPELHNWLWLGGAAVLGFAAGNYFSLLNIRTAGEKLNSLLSPGITALTIILSYFIFGERLAIHQWAGILLALITIIVFLIKRNGLNSFAHTRVGTLSGLATIVLISFTIICTIKGAGNISFLLVIWLRLFISFILILFLFIIRKEWQHCKKTHRWFYPAVLIGVLAQTIGAAYLWLYASFHILQSVFQIILASLPLWVYAVDVYFLKKTAVSFSFLIAAGLAGAGIVLAML